MTPKFTLGQVVATPGALAHLGSLGLTPLPFLSRHMSGDWGDLDDEDKASNNEALIPQTQGRILSSYNLSNHSKVWVITEYDRSVTTVLLPEEY